MKNNFVEEKQTGFSYRFDVEEFLFKGKSDFQSVEVVKTAQHGRMLLNDGFVMLSERDEFVYHEMMSHIPMFTHPIPKRVLIIGGGDGGTAREVLRHPSVEFCQMVEIDSMVVEASKMHLPFTAVGMEENPRFDLKIEDGVKFVRDCVINNEEKFDVILVDSTDPIGPAQPLFGGDFYDDIEKALSENGIVVSQAESPFYNGAMQSKMAQILSERFPVCQFLNFSNLTYPGGLWSFSFASKGLHPIKNFDLKRYDKLQLEMKYYNSNIHSSCFSLPQFQKDRLGILLKEK